MQHLYPLDRTISVPSYNERGILETPETSTETSNWQLILWLIKPLGWYLVLPILPRLILLGFTFCLPFFIQRLLSFLSSPEQNSTATGSTLVAIAVFTYLGIAFSTSLYWYYQERFQSILRAFLVSAIYQKTTHIYHVGDGGTTAVKLMGADVERIYTGLRQMHEIWANVIQTSLALWLLQRQLGLAFLAPLVLVFFGFCMSFAISKRAVPYQAAWMASLQTRIGVTSSVLANIKNLRVSGMTTPATALVKHERESEIRVGGRSRLLTAISASLSGLPQAVAPAVAFAFGPHVIDQTRAFTALSLLGLLTSPLMVVLQIFPIIAASFACLRRIREFLLREGRTDTRVFHLDNPSDEKVEKSKTSQGDLVIIQDGSFGWKEGGAILTNINLRLPKSSFTFVTGLIASGKSTLCRALLGEVPFVTGIVTLRSTKIAYCDQTPFLFNTSIMENIIGFSSFDTTRYAEVIEVTMLAQDLKDLPAGDKTIVGNKGISISGGQRQRVSLARTLYHNAEILVLDDVFSGLDSSTQGRVFQAVLGPNGLLRRRGITVVVCTHATNFMSVADYVVTLSADGEIAEQRADFKDPTHNQRFGPVRLTDAIEEIAQVSKQKDQSDEIIIEASKPITEVKTTVTSTNSLPRKLEMTSAPVATPSADMKIYRHWLSTIGVRPLLLFLLLIIGNGFFSNFPTIWLKFWSSDSTSKTPEHTFAYWIGLYALFGIGTIICVFPAGLVMLRTGVRLTGTHLHHSTIDTVMHSSLRFLSDTEVGKILNLFSQDMNILDTQLPRMVNNMEFTLSNAIGQAVVIAVSSVWLTVSYPVFIVLLWLVQRIYLPSSKRLRILDLEAKTPLYSNFLETLSGLPTIRAFNQFSHHRAHNNHLLDTSQRPSYLLAMAQQWLMFTMNFVVAIIAVMLVALATQLQSDAGNIGAALVTLMSLGGTLTTIVVAYTGLETSLGAVTRHMAFGEETEVEGEGGGGEGGDGVEKAWPMGREIEIKEVHASYSGMYSDRVLKGLRLSIKAGEKVAICGRTGSGKSSILALILRLIEPLPPNTTEASSSNGQIFIDGIPLHIINHTLLRKHILSASQDAVFLPIGNTFRSNLDPWNEATADECTSVLHEVNLLSLITSKGGLEAPLSVLSAGQKQLFALARLMLRRVVKIRETGVDGGLLLLDEITASVDDETEEWVREVVERVFGKWTVVLITHQFEMAIACGRVVVLERGRVVEDGEPGVLIEKEGGVFRNLWEGGNVG